MSSSPAAETTAPSPRDLSEPSGPSPLPSDVSLREIEDEGSVEGLPPPSGIPNVEETEPPAFLDNPLTTDDEEPNDIATTVSTTSGHVTTVSTAPGHVTECATI